MMVIVPTVTPIDKREEAMVLTPICRIEISVRPGKPMMPDEVEQAFIPETNR